MVPIALPGRREDRNDASADMRDRGDTSERRPPNMRRSPDRDRIRLRTPSLEGQVLATGFDGRLPLPARAGRPLQPNEALASASM